MKNVISLSIEEQNNFNESVLDSIINDNQQYAEGNIADYLLSDFDAYPEGWNSLFEYPYDEVSAKAKEDRRVILKNLLVMRGFVPSIED